MGAESVSAVISLATLVLGELHRARAKQAADAQQQDVAFIKESFEMMKSFLMDMAGESGQRQVTKTWVRQVRELAYDGEDCLQELFLHLENPARVSAKSKLLSPRDTIAAQMKDLRCKVERVTKSRQLYHTDGVTTQPPVNSVARVPTRAMSRNASLIGREIERSHLVRLISQQGEQPQVISIWGMVGIGKTSLAESVYESKELSSMFEQHAWITVQHRSF